MGIWYVNLAGQRKDLEELVKRYHTEHAHILEKNGRYILLSELFDSLISEDEVYNTAKDLLKKLNGSMSVIWTGYKAVEIQSIGHISDQGKRKVSVRAFLEVVEAPPDVKDGPNWMGKGILEIAKKNSRVSKVLSLFSFDLDWVTLYKISEVIYEDQGQDIIKKGWITKEEIDRFRGTVNSYGAIGEMARHARDTDKPPSTPMPLLEAKALIHKVAQRWLEEKASILKAP